MTDIVDTSWSLRRALLEEHWSLLLEKLAVYRWAANEFRQAERRQLWGDVFDLAYLKLTGAQQEFFVEQERFKTRLDGYELGLKERIQGPRLVVARARLRPRSHSKTQTGIGARHHHWRRRTCGACARSRSRRRMSPVSQPRDRRRRKAGIPSRLTTESRTP